MRKELALLLASVLAVAVAAGMVFPFIQLYLKELGASDFGVGVVMSMLSSSSLQRSS